MNLSQLLKPWVQGEISDCMITGLKNDSRQVEQGDLFIAYPGAAADGRMYMEKAILSGAAAIAYDPTDFPASCSLPTEVPCIPVHNISNHLAAMACCFYHNPSHLMNVTGITGTNGKTTIAYQLAQAHDLLKRKAAYIGTIGQGAVHSLMPLDNTTPDALCVQRLLYEYKQQGITEVCMEVSSHALSQHRVDGVAFKHALFTNLTLDHLDYHLSMESYAAAKAQLFASDSLEWAIINQDAAYQDLMSAALKPHVKRISYGMSEGCDVRALNWCIDMSGTLIMLDSPWGKQQMRIKALGQFNIYNSLAIFTHLMQSGYLVSEVLQVMAQLNAAPGRMELVAQSPYVLVDYAHTPDALEHVLMTLSELKKADLWVVFGCGGDRDKTKRPIMGKAASLYANHLIVTSDNPRSEDPELIISQILEGIPESASITKIIDRKAAITYALEHAKQDDIILIAGKGHESYQQIGSEKYMFSDQGVVRALKT